MSKPAREAHDAEDAFQATFLTLARTAGSLRQPDLLGPRLHGVACRTARRLKDKDARRRRHEAEASMSRATLLDHADRHDPRRAIDDEIEARHEEIERLPEGYSSGWDCDIRRWDVEARKQLPPPARVRATGVVAASPDGRTLAYQDDSGTLRLLGAGNGAELRTLALAWTSF